MQKEVVLVLDFGAQYNQLIARRLREASVYSEVVSGQISAEEVKAKGAKAIVLSGGPAVVYAEGAPSMDPAILDLGLPILGICYGAQLLVHLSGGKVAPALAREYGQKELQVQPSAIFKSVPAQSDCWMSHTYQVSELPAGFEAIASTDHCPVAAFAQKEKQIYGFQYHPEVMHTAFGQQMLHNFLYEVAGLKGDWQTDNFIEASLAEIRAKIGDKKVLCALSGGVDSSVAAMLVHKAVGKQLTCIFVDNGLLRKNEAEQVEQLFRQELDLQLICVDAKERFLNQLAGVSDPEEKRKRIGETFIRVFEDEAKKIGEVDFLVQGTIYPDVIESGAGHAAVIKSHHNVGGLPDVVDFKELIEPLRLLFKDEVRTVGAALGLPSYLVNRQPFPGPGLAIRVIGDITEPKLAILREADYIFRSEIEAADLEEEVWQYFAVLTGIRTVGVMGDERTYHYTLGLRAVSSVDGMTADWSRLPLPLLAKISNRIVNEVEQVNRIVYDITSKPPATIEWE